MQLNFRATVGGRGDNAIALPKPTSPLAIRRAIPFLQDGMHFTAPIKLDELANFIGPFIDIVGQDRWSRRAYHLDRERSESPARWKIVADYHWLEMAINFQAELLRTEGKLRPDLADASALVSLHFAATTVEVYRRLSDKGRQVLAGRLRDALKAENGFASIYLELDLAQRLMDAGFDVSFPDIEGHGQFDLLFARNGFAGEVECKSLSADAGRQIHRKDFYRFMEELTPALIAHTAFKRREVLVITLDGRLSPKEADQFRLLVAATTMLSAEAPTFVAEPGFEIERRDFGSTFDAQALTNSKQFYSACGKVFGPNTHAAGGLTWDGGCIVVMRSRREDDTSKPMLNAMRKAGDQFTGKRPAFIAIQEHGIEAADLMLPHVRRRAGILAYALFGHYGADHVNALYITGYGAVVAGDGYIGTPAFSVLNPAPRFPVETAKAEPFLKSMQDADYAALIGAPLPTANISNLAIEPDDDGA